MGCEAFYNELASEKLFAGQNMYGYVEGDPIMFNDPTGQFSASPKAIETALARAGLAEVAGGGPEDPLADAAALVAIVDAIENSDDSSSSTDNSSSDSCPKQDNPCWRIYLKELAECAELGDTPEGHECAIEARIRLDNCEGQGGGNPKPPTIH